MQFYCDHLSQANTAFSHSAIQPFSHSAIQPFSHSAIQPFSHSAHHKLTRAR
ncbi:hypothetical protein MN869_15280 [Acinetobacter sp. NIPH1876]|uniref:hypothetical protein n=1 Tax=Acinetobacter sp. NIPH1876 TaxID=2924041 RepID=UPI001FAE3202|nr:hypothetical protein [Acinetobacter sp. NIPH1876]MCJ0829808.1 hypothetical protein [Acinetobacter sp. NIPH1876]